MNLAIIIIGWIATAISVSTYAPQSLKVLKARKGESINILTFIIATAGTLSILLFGSLARENGEPLYPAWATNMIIGFMMIPIIYYSFKTANKLYAGFALIGIILIVEVLGILFTFVLGDVSKYFGLTFSILGGFLLAFPMIPQTLTILKTKKIGDFSIMTAFLIFLGSAIWALWWLLNIINNPGGSWENIVGYSMGIFTGVFAILSTIPTLHFYLKQK